MSSFSVYLDAAGKESDGPGAWCVVAGFAARVDRWERSELDWNLLLAEYRVPYLQMSLLHARKGHFEIEPWKSDSKYVESFLIRAAEIIHSTVQFWSVHCVRYSDFEYVANKHKGLKAYSNPYGHCASAVATILQVDCMMLEIPRMPQVEHFLEEGDDGVRFIQEVFRHSGRVPPLVRPGKPQPDKPIKRYYVHFQAADWLAFESRKFLKPSGQRIRASHKALIEGIPGEAKRWTVDD